MDIGIEIRKIILSKALFLEGATSAFLGGLLGIKDFTKSNSLGNKSSSLSFNQKIDLLIDLNVLKSNEKNKFKKFMEIRNQFMHNLSASTYEKCCFFLDGTDSYLLKNYPQSEQNSKEEQLRLAVDCLSDEVLEITFNITTKVYNKIQQDAENEVYKISNEAFNYAIHNLKNKLDDYIDDLIKSDKTFDIQNFKNLGTYISKTIHKLWKKKMDEKLKAKKKAS